MFKPISRNGLNAALARNSVSKFWGKSQEKMTFSRCGKIQEIVGFNQEKLKILQKVRRKLGTFVLDCNFVWKTTFIQETLCAMVGEDGRRRGCCLFWSRKTTPGQ